MGLQQQVCLGVWAVHRVFGDREREFGSQGLVHGVFVVTDRQFIVL